ncbi:tail completion protein gp17 [Sphingomonas sp.]|uniref:tail completion protein gp17 n=1 Tax=Sphingomonas sp. TaxID=28214 RepID=UPI003B3B076C
MAQDFILPVRRAILPRMKGFAALTALIPPGSMWPSTVPASRTFPFTRFGSISATPFRASGLNSSALRISIQAFSQALLNAGGATIATAEDQILKIGSAIKDALDGATLTLEGNAGKVRLTWIGSSPQRDGDEASAWMTTVTFLAEVAG